VFINLAAQQTLQPKRPQRPKRPEIYKSTGEAFFWKVYREMLGMRREGG